MHQIKYHQDQMDVLYQINKLSVATKPTILRNYLVLMIFIGKIYDGVFTMMKDHNHDKKCHIQHQKHMV